MKKFEDENEYQEWVNSPYKRTPYTCVVKSTGKVYYDDGDDNDLSITLVIKKSGWMKIGSRGIMENVSAITINGREVDLDTELGKGYESSYYYRNDKDYYLKAEDDFLWSPLVNETDRGGNVPPTWEPDKGAVLNYAPRKFGRMNYSSGSHRESRRFLKVMAGDIVKIYCKHNYYKILASPRGYDEYYIFDHTPSTPYFGKEITKFAKEIIIGDGFTGRFVDKLFLDYTKKVFIGKNMTYIYPYDAKFSDNHNKCKMYVRKTTKVVGGGFDENDIIKI